MEDLTSKVNEQISKLKNTKPLDLPSALADFELADSREADRVLDEIVAEFEKDGGTANSVLKPIALSILDGLLEGCKAGREMRKKGVTASRLLSECEAFSYPNGEIGRIPGVAYVDWKNARDYRTEFASHSSRHYKHHRDNFADSKAMSAYKDKAFQSAGSKTVQDEYTGRRDIWEKEKNPDRRYAFENETEARSHVANTDHIVPLKTVVKELAGNYALSRKDIKRIANAESNFALTNAKLNKSKGEKSNSQYVREHPELDETTKQMMLDAEKNAERAIEKDVNDTVLANLTDGTKKGQKVRARAVKKATDQAADYAVGNLVLFIVKPIYFELKDAFRNGFAEGVDCADVGDAIKVRFTRVKDYVLENASRFLGDGLMEFAKGFVSALIEGIIGLFLGVFKCVLKLIKEGIRIFVQAGKVLWGKDAKNRSSAEKGDAILKLIGGSVAGLAGIGIDALLESMGTPEALSVPLSTMLSGIVSALFMYILDRADLFSVRAEKRYARVKEVFEARIADMKNSSARLSAVVSEKMRADRINYMRLEAGVNDALQNHDINKLDQALNGMADFFDVMIPYDDNASFVDYVKTHREIKIGNVA